MNTLNTRMVAQEVTHNLVSVNKKIYLRVDYDIWLEWNNGNYYELHSKDAVPLEAQFKEITN